MNQNCDMRPNMLFVNRFNVELIDNSVKEEDKTNPVNISTVIKFGVQTKESLQKNKLKIFDDDDEGLSIQPIIEPRSKLVNMNEMIAMKTQHGNSKEESKKDSKYKEKNEESSENKEDCYKKSKDKSSRESTGYDKYDSKSSSKDKRRKSVDRKHKKKRKLSDSFDPSREKKRRERQISVENCTETKRTSSDFGKEKRRYSDNRIKYENEKRLSNEFSDRRKSYSKNYDDSPKSASYSRDKERYSDMKFRRLPDNSCYGERKRYSDPFTYERREYNDERKFVRPRTPEKGNIRRSLENSSSRNSIPSKSSMEPTMKLNSFKNPIQRKTKFHTVKSRQSSYHYNKNISYQDHNKNRNKSYKNIIRKKVIKHLKQSKVGKCDITNETTDQVKSRECETPAGYDNNIIESQDTGNIDLIYNDLEFNKSPLKTVENGDTYNPSASEIITKTMKEELPNKYFSKIKDHKIMRKIIPPEIAQNESNHPVELNEIADVNLTENVHQKTPQIHKPMKQVSVGKNLDINDGNEDAITHDGDDDDDDDDEESGDCISNSGSEKTTSMRLSLHENDNLTPLMELGEPCEQHKKPFPLVYEVYSDDELENIDIGLLTSIPEEYRRNLNEKFTSITSKPFFINFQQLIYEALKQGLPGVSFDRDKSKFNFNMRFLPDSLVLSIEKLVTHYMNKMQIY